MASRRDIEAGRSFVRLYLKDQLTRALVRSLHRAGQRLRNFGRMALGIAKRMAVVGAAIATPIAIATRVYAGFDDQMRTTKAVTGATGDAFERLTEQAKMLGRTTSFTASQVAAGMTSLGRAGFRPDEIEQAIGPMLNLARATGTELAQAADIASASLRSFGLEASEMGRVSDVMVATANNSSQTLEDLGEAMKMAAPIADEFGLSMEDTAKAIGTMANFGIKGTMAGTSLRQMFAQLSDPKIQKRLRELGVASGTFAEEMIGIGKAMEGMSGRERIALGKELFGQRAFGGGLKLTRGGFEQLAKAIDNAGGTAAKTAEEMDAGIGGSLRRLWSALEGIVIQIGEAVAPWISFAADKTSEWANEIVDLAKDTDTAMAAIGIAWLRGRDWILDIWENMQTKIQVAMAETISGVKIMWSSFANWFENLMLDILDGLFTRIHEAFREFMPQIEIELKAIFGDLVGGGMATAMRAGLTAETTELTGTAGMRKAADERMAASQKKAAEDLAGTVKALKQALESSGKEREAAIAKAEAQLAALRAKASGKAPVFAGAEPGFGDRPLPGIPPFESRGGFSLGPTFSAAAAIAGGFSGGNVSDRIAEATKGTRDEVASLRKEFTHLSAENLKTLVAIRTNLDELSRYGT